MISNYDELPVINKRVYDLVVKYENGNVSKFAERIGVTQQVLNRIFKKDSRNGKYPSVSPDIKNGLLNSLGIDEVSLITGEGNMLKEDDKDMIQKDIVEKGENNYKLVPLVHIDSVGGMRSNNSITNEPQYIEGYIPFVNAKDDDKAIFQSGTSMIPTIPPGSIMQLREVKNWREYFGYGNIFVIELTDGRRITKEVRRYDENSKDYVLCVSHNPDVAPEELPKSMIASVWKVIKILTDKGW